jgi:hypothetical protein
LVSGIETDGGVLVFLYGDALFRGEVDSFTHVTQEGRRYVDIGPLSGFISNMKSSRKSRLDIDEIASSMHFDLINVYDKMYKKYGPQIVNLSNQVVDINRKEYYNLPNGKDNHVNNNFSLVYQGNMKMNKVFSGSGNVKDKSIMFEMFMRLMRSILDSSEYRNTPLGAVAKEFNKIKSKMISDYLDGSERVLSSDEMYRKLLFASGSGFGDREGFYDESIMNNFRIDAVYVDYQIDRVDDQIERFRAGAAREGITDQKFIDFISNKMISRSLMISKVKEAQQHFRQKMGIVSPRVARG